MSPEPLIQMVAYWQRLAQKWLDCGVCVIAHGNALQLLSFIIIVLVIFAVYTLYVLAQMAKL